MIITIDGPTASGKSTMGRLLAEYFGFQYLNSGAIYRAIAYVLMEKEGYTLEQLKAPNAAIIKKYFVLGRLTYAYDRQGEHVVCDGENIWPYLKSSVIDQASSIISMHPVVREELLNFQRNFAQKHDVVVDGRDCGSVVFPHADVKFFLKAGLDERASRWQQVQQARGVFFAIDAAAQKVAERDSRDMTRESSPLVVPEGAIVIDNSAITIDQTLAIMKQVIQNKVAAKN